MTDIEQPNVLLERYFGKGESWVMVVDDRGRHHARLETCWDGTGLRWWLQFVTPATSAKPEPVLASSRERVLAAVEPPWGAGFFFWPRPPTTNSTTKPSSPATALPGPALGFFVPWPAEWRKGSGGSRPSRLHAPLGAHLGVGHLGVRLRLDLRPRASA